MKTKQLALSQYYLISDYLRHIVAQKAHTGAGENIVEIGPGKGFITEAIYNLLENERMGKSLYLIELDLDHVRLLQTKFLSDYVHVIHKDALAFNYGQFAQSYSTTICGNIPFYLTRKLCKLLIRYHDRFSKVVLLLPNVMYKLFNQPKQPLFKLMNLYYRIVDYQLVPATYFSPKPKSDACLLHLESKKFIIEDHSSLQNFVYSVCLFQNHNIHPQQASLLGLKTLKAHQLSSEQLLLLFTQHKSLS